MPESKSKSSSWAVVKWWQSLNPAGQTLAIVLGAPLLVLNGWALSTIFGYFESLFVILLVAALLSFLLNYPVRWLVQQGAERTQAALLVFLFSLTLLLAAGVTLVPLALSQAQQLVARLPELIDSGQRQLMALNEYVDQFGWPISLDGLIGQVNDKLKSELQAIAGRAVNLAVSFTVVTVVRLLDVLLVVILTFYLLQHSDEVWTSIVDWLPEKVRKPFTDTLRESFQNYFIGQIVLAMCMAFGLTSTYLLLKVPFGLLFGLTVGLMALVPFGGTVGITTVTLLVALQNIGLALQVLAGSVLVQQIVENLIAPRVLGSFTGLNPFWVFVALLTGVRVGGLLGVIVAVPTAVVVKEILLAIRSSNRPDPPQGIEPAAEPETRETMEQLASR
ncbi:MAG: AI-2E family transporter [Pseudanabaenaceae cyanobacterium]